MTVIYVTHDQEEAMSMSDRIAILNHGRIHQVGSPGEVYERPANSFVGRFLGEANLLEGAVTAQGDIARLVLSSGEELHAPCGSGCDGGRGLLFIRPERVEITAGATGGSDPSANTLAGSVRRGSFLGNILRYAVDIDGVAPMAKPVIVDLQNAIGVTPLPRGAPVTLRWPVADSLILPADGA
jgi:putative spermidine/putrescine transport system ATP-binding protein